MASSNDNEEPPRRRNWISVLAPDAVNAAGAAFARAGFADPSLVTRWGEIAGPETARLARPLRFSEGAHGGVLTLMAEPGAAIFLQHESRMLCERINTYLGRTAVTRLKFVQGPLTHRPAPPKPATISVNVPSSDPVQRYKGPEGIREALWRLARARRAHGE